MALSRSIAELLVKNNISGEDVVSVLGKYKLLSLLPHIKRDLEKFSKTEGDREIAYVESPFALDEKSSARIKRIVGNDLATLEVTLNPDLLAGFKARYKGKLYDGSAERIIKHLTH